MKVSPSRCQMIRRSSIVAGITVAVCLIPNWASCQELESLAGDWIARLDLASQTGLLWINVRSTPDKGWKATVNLRPSGAISHINAEARHIADSWRDASMAVERTSWRLAAGTAPNSLQVDVHSTGNTPTATVRFRDQSATAVLHHLVSVDKLLYKRYAGAYVLSEVDPESWTTRIVNPNSDST